MDLEILNENWRRQVMQKFWVKIITLFFQVNLLVNKNLFISTAVPILGVVFLCFWVHILTVTLPDTIFQVKTSRRLYLHRCPCRVDTFSGNQSELFGDQ